MYLGRVGIPRADTTAAATRLGCSVMKSPFKYLGVMVGGVGIPRADTTAAATRLGCSVMKSPFKYLGVMVGGSTPIYCMSLYKVPKSVLHSVESIRRKFFNGTQGDEKKVTWVKWSKVLAVKKHGGLGVSSYYALNRALLFKWVWKFISQDNSLWFRFISSMPGLQIQKLSSYNSLIWNVIIREVSVLKSLGVDLISHCKKRVGNGMLTRLWSDVWLGDKQFRYLFPRIFALEVNKDCTVADKLQVSLDLSLWRSVRGGAEAHQLDQLQELTSSMVLADSVDRWY
nr:RNA-directed DNA polymerase, eukaryota, reverse transcriptase zinc-binding domain protein [Tanacetum cinerariifolium]